MRPRTDILVAVGLIGLAGLALGSLLQKPLTPLSDDFFLSGLACQINIELSATSVSQLEETPRQYVSGTVRVFGKDLTEVRIKLKGSGTFRPIHDKPNLTLDFQKLDHSQFPGGLQKIHLNNSLEDGSYLKEKLGSEMFHAAGIPAQRVGHAWVTINGRSLGLYVLKEGLTEDFFSRYFHDASGTLLDQEDVRNFDQSFADEAGQPSSVQDAQTKLNQLASAVAEPDLARRWVRLREVIDLDRFLSLMAMEVIVAHWDGYCLAENNYRMYLDRVSDNLIFLPNGMDQIFAKADYPLWPEMSGRVARSVMEIPEGQRQYAEKLESVSDRFLDIDPLVNRVNELTQGLEKSLPSNLFREMEPEVRELCAQLKERGNFVKKQIAEADKFLAVSGTGNAVFQEQD